MSGMLLQTYFHAALNVSPGPNSQAAYPYAALDVSLGTNSQAVRLDVRRSPIKDGFESFMRASNGHVLIKAVFGLL